MSRDWQKDMERVENFADYQHWIEDPEPAEVALRYWLQQYAAERDRADQAELLIDNLGGGDRYKYIRHVRKKLEDEITLLVEHITEIEAREQKLREAIESSMELGMLEYAPYAYEHFEEALSTLYPKEGETK